MFSLSKVEVSSIVLCSTEADSRVWQGGEKLNVANSTAVFSSYIVTSINNEF